MSVIKLALLRHGYTAWNHAGRIQGLTDVPLTDDSIQTLAALALPEQWQQATLFASPLSRAHKTATVLTGRTPIITNELIEMAWGDWEGEHAEQLITNPANDFKAIENWGWQYRPPGGESIAEVRDRAIGWAMQLSGDSVAVCHIGVMRVLLAVAHNWHFAGPAPFKIKRNRLYVLNVTASSGSVEVAEPMIVRLTERGNMDKSS